MATRDGICDAGDERPATRFGGDPRAASPWEIYSILNPVPIPLGVPSSILFSFFLSSFHIHYDRFLFLVSFLLRSAYGGMEWEGGFPFCCCCCCCCRCCCCCCFSLFKVLAAETCSHSHGLGPMQKHPISPNPLWDVESVIFCLGFLLIRSGLGMAMGLEKKNCKTPKKTKEDNINGNGKAYSNQIE